jgi:hypothetical protein
MKRLQTDCEPLGDERWNAIEHDLFARLDAQAAPLVKRPSRGRWIAWAAAAVLLLAIGAITYRAIPRSTPVATAPGAGGTRMTAGESTLDVASGSVVSVHGDDQRGIVVNLDRGSVDFEVTPRKGRPTYVVETPHARVEVVGTHFRVEVQDKVTRVAVTTGIVRVSANGGERLIQAGQTIGSDEIEPASDSVSVMNLPVASAPSGAGETVKPLTERQRFELAESLERSDPERAIATYDGLARGHGTWADNALFAEARLQADRGKFAEARKLLDEYLQRSPHGPNADDARALLEHLGP